MSDSKTPTPNTSSPAVQEKFHFLLVPDDGEPSMLESTDQEQLFREAYSALLATKSSGGKGWAYFIINGTKCMVSMPKQVFTVRMPNGDLAELRDPAPPVFDQNGRFKLLAEMP
jgi:hypothetical protein